MANIPPVEGLVADRLAPISLDELNSRAALQVRVDSKYVLHHDRFAAFVEAVRDRCQVLRIGGRVAQRYDTVYFDSPDLISYHDHLQRRRQTYKLRTRVYVGSGLQVFEVKMRDGRGHTVKRKIDHAAAPDVVGDTATGFYRDTIQNYYGLSVRHPVSPSMRNQYSRITLASTTTPERTTVDFDLDVLRGDAVVGGMRRNVVLVETKSAHGNGEVDRILWRLGARPVRVSKYCIGIAQLHPHFRVNRYARAMNRFFLPARTSLAAGDALLAVPAEPALEARPAPRAPRPPRPPRPIRPPTAGAAPR